MYYVELTDSSEHGLSTHRVKDLYHMFKFLTGQCCIDSLTKCTFKVYDGF